MTMRIIGFDGDNTTLLHLDPELAREQPETFPDGIYNAGETLADYEPLNPLFPDEWVNLYTSAIIRICRSIATGVGA